MAKIEIDGRELEVPNGTTIIQAADEAGIYIPRFCYHKKLSVAANCRMCLVEVEKMPKPQPACATPVAEGMKICTKSEKALAAQKAVMEFLLINHPLDCPVCDQGGQCELQDLAMGFGADVSLFEENKRAVVDPDLGPLVATEMTRCIHCTRCVRFGEEIAGLREMGATDRGEHMAIGTYVKHTLRSELSGNIIDVCPVGALTSKPFRFKARAWEMQQVASIAPHDCIGSNVHISYVANRLLRVNPCENEELNEVWLSDRDRFSYEGVNSEQRLTAPCIKRNGVWQDISWQEAFKEVAKKLDHHLVQDASQIGVLVSPSSTVEELYLLRKFCELTGISNIDFRLQQTDKNLAVVMKPRADISIADLEKQNAILLIGSHIQQEQPIAGLKVRKAQLRGAQVMAVNMMDYRFNFKLAHKLIHGSADFVKSLASIVLAAAELSGKESSVKISGGSVHAEARHIAEKLLAAEQKVLVVGLQAQQHQHASEILGLAQALSDLTGAKIIVMTEGANSPAAYALGMASQQSVIDMLEKQLKTYILLNVEPELDVAASALAKKAMQKSDGVIALSAFASPGLLEYADIILPIATFGETSGTLVNVNNQLQSFTGAVQPKGEARPAWKVLRVLGNVFHLEGFDYTSSEEVLADARAHMKFEEKPSYAVPAKLSLSGANQWQLVSEKAMYSVDALVRHSKPLQAMNKVYEANKARINQVAADSLKLKTGGQITIKQGDAILTLPLLIDERVPDHCVYVMTGIEETEGLVAPFGAIEIVKN